MKESIKRRIIEKARDLLFTKTEEEITMNLIAGELGITAPTLYHYFKGKEELLLAANNLITEEVTELMSMRFPPSVPAEMRIITLTSIIAEYFMKNGLPASYLVEDPIDKPIKLKEFRKKMNDLFTLYYKDGRKPKRTGVEQATFRYLATVEADLVYLRNTKKPLNDDFAEKAFSTVK